MGQWAAPALKSIKYAPSSRYFWSVLSYPVGAAFFLYMRIVEGASKVTVSGPGAEFSGPAIYVNWHQHIPHLLAEHGKHRRWLLTSKAPYMEPIAKWCELDGLQLIRGGSGEGAHVVPLLAEKIAKGDSVILAVDGPSGPIYRAKRGCIEISRQTGAPIIPVGYRCARAKPNAKRWDRSLRAKPFDRIEIIYGKPIFLKAETSFEKAVEEVENGLNSIRG